MPDEKRARRWIEALEAKTVEHGATPEEAASAHAKARELRAKHSIVGEVRTHPRREVWMAVRNDSNKWRRYGDTWVPPNTYTVSCDSVRDLYTPEVPWWDR